MNKEQSADDPSVDLIQCKVCLIAPFLSYPDVVIACARTWSVSGSIPEQLRQRW